MLNYAKWIMRNRVSVASFEDIVSAFCLSGVTNRQIIGGLSKYICLILNELCCGYTNIHFQQASYQY